MRLMLAKYLDIVFTMLFLGRTNCRLSSYEEYIRIMGGGRAQTARIWFRGTGGWGQTDKKIDRDREIDGKRWIN